MIENLFLILTSGLIYFSSLNFFFVGDDFANLTTPFSDIISIVPTHNHYFPVSWSILYISKFIFGTNPFPYHLMIISIFIINVLLIKTISGYFFTGKKWPVLTAFLFAVFFANYEVVFWISVIFINTSLMFYLLGFNYFARRKYVLFILFSLLSILSQEYGLLLLLLCFFYDYFKQGKINYKRIVKYFFIPLTVFIFISITKLKLITISVFANKISPRGVLVSLFTFVTQSIYPNPLFWEIIFQARKNILRLSLFLILSLIIFSFTLIKVRNIKGIFLPVIIIVLTSFFISLTSLAQMRYFYFLAFPSALFLTYILKEIKNKQLFYLLIIFIVVPQLMFIGARTREWAIASGETRRVVASLSEENGCFQIKNNEYPSWLGDDRFKAYMIVHPERVMKFFFGKDCL